MANRTNRVHHAQNRAIRIPLWLWVLATPLFFFGVPYVSSLLHPPVNQIMLVDVSGSMFSRHISLYGKEQGLTIKTEAGTQPLPPSATPAEKAEYQKNHPDLVYVSLARCEIIVNSLGDKDKWELYYYVHEKAHHALPETPRDKLAMAFKTLHLELLQEWNSESAETRAKYKNTDQAIPFEKAAEIVQEEQRKRERLRILICCDGEQEWSDKNMQDRVKAAVATLAKSDNLEALEVRGIKHPQLDLMEEWTKPLKAKIKFKDLLDD